jgi:hypothetical protein
LLFVRCPFCCKFAAPESGKAEAVGPAACRSRNADAQNRLEVPDESTDSAACSSSPAVRPADLTGYERAIGAEFGRSVPGIFTDEPNIAPGRNAVRYSPVLFEAFQQRWGYDLRLHLPGLFLELGDYRKVRYHYYRLLLELFSERWSKPWNAYTESRNLAWTGHYWEHGWPSPHHGPDNMAMYAWHQLPGIDMLFNALESRPEQFGNVRAVKELSSVANQLGRRRTLSETYGAAGWELTFEDMKRLGDWQFALGVNLVNQHLSFMTLKGRRKGDFPQSFFPLAPCRLSEGRLSEWLWRRPALPRLGPDW